MAPLHQFAVLCLCWISASLADYYNPQYYDPYTKTPVYYHYNWQVKDYPSGNDYRHEETRNEDLTTGQYQVLLPGGRHQTVNYRVNKGSGFMADVSYQGDSNYFTFKQKYRDADGDSPAISSYYNSPPPSASPPAAYPAAAAYPAYPKPSAETYAKPDSYPPAYPKPEPYYPPEQQQPTYYSSPARTYEEPAYVKTAQYVPTPAPVDDEPAVTEKAQVSSSADSMNAKNDYTVPMYPLYRSDYYSARAKSGKSASQVSSGGYAVDEAGETYIKPAAMYYVPERLGVGYDVDHRKGTMRRPAKSDYEAPERLTQL